MKFLAYLLLCLPCFALAQNKAALQQRVAELNDIEENTDGTFTISAKKNHFSCDGILYPVGPKAYYLAGSLSNDQDNDLGICNLFGKQSIHYKDNTGLCAKHLIPEGTSFAWLDNKGLLKAVTAKEEDDLVIPMLEVTCGDW